MAQTTPQAPQFFSLVRGFTQAPEQSISPAAHWLVQVPPEQTSPVVQVLLHTPQLLGSVSRSVQAPLQLV